MMADVATSFAIFEPPAKKMKREVIIPDAVGSNDMDGDLETMRPSSGVTKIPPPQRSRRTAAVIAQLCTSDTLQTVKRNRTRKDTPDDTEKEFQTSWICGECKQAECRIRDDADQLLVCEGPCRRLFHYPCAGLAQPPAKDDEAYTCQDCQRSRHVCAYCHDYGVDEQDVFPCTAVKCGLFFHEACLEMANVPVRLIPTTNSFRIRRKFTCPSHTCGTCGQDDMIDKERQSNLEARKCARTGRKKIKPPAISFGKKKELTMVSWYRYR